MSIRSALAQKSGAAVSEELLAGCVEDARVRIEKHIGRAA
jgi:hypothetical protein